MLNEAQEYRTFRLGITMGFKHLLYRSLQCFGLLLIVSVTAASSEKSKIVLGAFEWPPYFSEKLPGGGFVTEITYAAFARVGYDLKVKFLPFARMIQQVKQGEVQGALGIFHSKQRSEFMAYSEPVYNSEVVFFCRREKPIKVSELESLSQYEIGVLRGGLTAKMLAEQGLKLSPVNNIDTNLRKLLRSRVDLVASDKLNFQYLLKQHYPLQRAEIITLLPSIKTYGIYNTISKKIAYQQIIADFNRGLQLLKDDGSYLRILQKHQVDFPLP